MTDEERRKLIKWLRDHGDGPLIWAAADEIERLEKESRKLKSELDYAWRRIEAETGARE